MDQTRHYDAYLALVCSKLEYGSVVWDPFLKNVIDRLERVQRSAARFIKGDYKSRHERCITNMLDDLETTPTEADVLVQGGERARTSYKSITLIPAKQFVDFVKKNIVERSVCNNNQCFKQLPAYTSDICHC